MTTRAPEHRRPWRGSLAAARLTFLLTLGWATLVSAQTPSSGQEDPDQNPVPQSLPKNRAEPSAKANPLGQTGQTANGRAGQRQTRDTTTGIVALKRVESRVANRVQSRLRSRIDRYYDPQANATSPFKVAGEETRRQGQTRR